MDSFLFWAIFCTFTTLLTQKLKLKRPGDIILLHMCTINEDHMMYGWFLRYMKGQSFLSFWAIFLFFDPLNNPKNQNFEKRERKSWRHYHFTLCVPQMTIIQCMVPEIWSMTYHMMYGSSDMMHERIFLSFCKIFCPFTPLTTQKIKILNIIICMSSNSGYHHFTQVY